VPEKRELNGIRAAKYAFKAASILVEILILLIVAGPMVGAVSPELGTNYSLGLGIDIQAIQPQIQQIFSSSQPINGTHQIIVPAFNNWPIAGKASLTLALIDANQTIYQTQPATLDLAPFQSGDLNVSMVVSPTLVTQMQGQSIGVGGSMSVSEGPFWTISVSLSK
jgi:hypothetical protein